MNKKLIEHDRISYAKCGDACKENENNQETNCKLQVEPHWEILEPHWEILKPLRNKK